MADAKRDNNYITTLIAVSNVDGITPVVLWADPTTHRLLVDLPGGAGTVTSVSVASANGFAGTVATATTTPAITISTTITGIIKGNGTAISAATDGTDYLSSTTGLKLDQTSAQTIANDTPIFGTLTASELVATTAAKKLQSLAVATYPSLTEISYVKGVTSAIQTQINAKISGLTVGTTTITSGTDTRILYNNAGVVGEYVVSGSGNVAMTTSPAFTTPNIGTPSAGTLTNCSGLPIAGLVASTSTAIGVGSIELGHASDTTITRVSAGVIAVEGVTLLTTVTGLQLSGGTMTGNITLGENTSIALDPAGSADGKYSGITIAGTAGATLAFGDLVYLSSVDSRWELADADAATTSDRMLGMCVLAAAADGDPTVLLLMGQIRADAAFPALTIGSAVYVGETAGDIQVAIPTGADNVIRRVGYALTADEIYFNPSMDSQTTVA